LIKSILDDVEYRFEPYSWPFIEEGWELGVKTDGKWVHVLGAGMFTKEVISKAGHNPEQISAFGFGIGIERLAMIKYAIDNMKDFWKNRLVSLNQFLGVH